MKYKANMILYNYTMLSNEVAFITFILLEIGVNVGQF